MYLCVECGHKSHKWLGKCPDCNEWNTFQQESTVKRRKESFQQKSQAINNVENENFKKLSTNIPELDRVLGNGLTIGSLNLLVGSPGVGKSTLLLKICEQLASLCGKNSVLYVSGEESASQIKQRAIRLKTLNEGIQILNEVNWQEVKKEIELLKPKFIILDSVQTLYSSEVQSSAGSVSQVKEITFEVMNLIKPLDITCFLVGHINKEGSVAGPKVLEHMVDTVLNFEGDKESKERTLKASKNRFGNINEVGLFEMNEDGIQSSKPNVEKSKFSTSPPFGVAYGCIQEGSRMWISEVESLVIENKFGPGKRITTGIEQSRLNLLLAIMDKYFKLPISLNDIYINSAGGLNLKKRDSDLTIIMSILSSYMKKPIPAGSAFLGEVGLTGEIRPIKGFREREQELKRSGVKRVYSHRDLKSVEELSTLFKTYL